MRGKEIDLGLLILRLGTGCLLLYYGCQKMLGLFGGAGFSHQIEQFQKLGIPAIFATLCIFAEFFGSLGLIFGFFTRVAAFGVAVNMLVATYFVTKAPGAIGDILKGSDPMGAGRAFFALLLFVAALSLLFTGAGKISMDAMLFKPGGSKKKK